MNTGPGSSGLVISLHAYLPVQSGMEPAPSQGAIGTVRGMSDAVACARGGLGASITDMPRTVNEVADALNVCPQTVRRWLKDGAVQGQRGSKTWTIADEEYQRVVSGALDDHSGVTHD